ncbi:ribosomal protein S18-alanine N-acetyltransferase [Fusobacterium sp.]|uniref:ribosomal protein S18-alanine N-acetyltransferase n=1 Tax=Fusobacterium TaxID=848 RepID=UPI0025C3D7C8|nr:ribosomal protein S18-alanine N-acetyltransferase [Fusobacterium sp.]MCI5724704.1 ribosomal protein S18-alanine N-acetyltransferase [Fusobacterium sp.]MCI7223229.1 ribosomal protein S18-alanine N-acetyltransferase [Fusobacterium sp.]MDD7392334.1 ribosomal protein S18-alanine N-acetyltransferase [Fusobacteriaceae bacterium]MDY5795720.1 ribosomal protein S18-alanine N-acetyltransferase [Fusobacterium gastrosuis]
MIVKLKKEYVESYEILKQIFELEKKIFLESFYSEESLIEMYNNPDIYKIYVYLEEKEVLAYLLVMDSIDCYEILKIAVDNNYRRMGYAKFLLEEIVIKEKVKKDIFLEVRESNIAAINFYKKNRFNQISIRKNYYKDNNENAIIMKLEVINE